MTPKTALPFVAAALLAAGCGSDVDPGATASESASELIASTVNGAVSASSASGASASLERGTPASRRALTELAALILPIPRAALATTACPALNSLSCSAGASVLNFNSCSFTRAGGGYQPYVWMGSRTISFSASGSPYCPGGSFPLASSGTGSSYPVSITRIDNNVRKISGEIGLSVIIDTQTPSGWDSSVGQKSGGSTVTYTSASAQSLTISGVHYLATKAYTTKKGVAKTATVWDHTVSTQGTLSSSLSSGTRTTNGTVVLQHNLAHYTATATLNNLTHNEASCGCLPTGGSITTVLTGGTSMTEILTLNGCGQGTLQSGATLSAAQASTGISVTLSHCI